jgi:ABC-type multidrug transport system fused ATPase/permease subunit
MTVNDAGPGEALTTSEIYQRGARLIRRSLRAAPGSHAIAVTGAIVFSLAAIVLTRVLARITDEVIVPGLDGDGVPDRHVWAAVGAILAVGMLRGAGAVVRRYYLAQARYSTEVLWRRQLFDQYLDQPMSFHDRRSTGALLAHVDNDLIVASTVLMPFAFTVATIVLLVAALVSLFVISPILALVAVVLFPALAVINHIYTRRVHEPAARAQAAVGAVSDIAHESFDGVLVVKALGREAAEVERLRVAGTRVRDERVVIGRLRAVFEPAIDALPNLGIIGVLALGALLVDRGTVSAGDLVGAMALFSILALPMRIVGFFLEEMPRSVVALDRIDRVLDVPLPPSAQTDALLPDGPLGVEFQGVTAGYDDTVVLKEVTFAVAPGEVVAIVGATGTGKSTLARLLAGLQAPVGGVVRLGGVDVTRLDPAARSASLAMAFQESFLFADTIAENISLGRPTTAAELERVLELAAAQRFVARLADGVATVVGERGVTLSGGQRQRIALARALLGHPRVVFLDDATAAVDPVVEARILDNLRHEAGLTLLVVAHRLSTIRLADRVVFIADGTVAAVGSHDDLLAEVPAYAALAQAYEVQPDDAELEADDDRVAS